MNFRQIYNESGVEDFCVQDGKLFLSKKDVFKCFNIEKFDLQFQLNISFWYFTTFNNCIIGQTTNPGNLIIYDYTGQFLSEINGQFILWRNKIINGQLVFPGRKGEDKILFALNSQVSKIEEANYINIQDFHLSFHNKEEKSEQEFIRGLITDSSSSIKYPNISQAKIYTNLVVIPTYSKHIYFVNKENGNVLGSVTLESPKTIGLHRVKLEYTEGKFFIWSISSDDLEKTLYVFDEIQN